MHFTGNMHTQLLLHMYILEYCYVNYCTVYLMQQTVLVISVLKLIVHYAQFALDLALHLVYVVKICVRYVRVCVCMYVRMHVCVYVY